LWYANDITKIFFHKYGKYLIILTSPLKLKMMKSTGAWKQDHVADQEDETLWKYRQVDIQMKQIEDVECPAEDGAEWSDTILK